MRAVTNQADPEFVEAIAAWALKDAARRSPVEAVERALADYGSPKIGTDEYVSVRHAAVVKSTTARLDVSWLAEQPVTKMDEAVDAAGTQRPSMFQAAVEAAAGALPDAPSATVEQVTLAVLRVALPLHETQHANALKAAHERAVRYELEAVKAAERAEVAEKEVRRYRSFCGEALCGDVERGRDEYQWQNEQLRGEVQRLQAKMAGLDDCLTATAAAKGSNRYAGQGQLITLLTVDDVREMIGEWREASADDA